MFATPVRSDSANERVLASSASTYRDPGVLHDSAKVFDRFSATSASYANCDTPQPVPSPPAHPASPDRRDNTSRITSSSPTSSYSPRADLIESDKDISICSTPHTQPADHDPHHPSPSFPAHPASSVPHDCTASLTEALSTFSEPT